MDNLKCPKIGDIVRADAIAKKGGHRKYIWAACEQCGRERWVISLKGQSIRKFCTCINGLADMRGELNPGWKGGRYVSGAGYIFVRLSSNDFFYVMAHKNGYVLEHRLVVAKGLGRCLHPWEIVHHKHTKYPAGSLEDKQDNSKENLQLVSGDRHNQITIMENRHNRIIHQNEQIADNMRDYWLHLAEGAH